MALSPSRAHCKTGERAFRPRLLSVVPPPARVAETDLRGARARAYIANTAKEIDAFFTEKATTEISSYIDPHPPFFHVSSFFCSRRMRSTFQTLVRI